MPSYRVKLGYTHGAFNQYKAGAVVELSEQEAAGFLDKLELVQASSPMFVVTAGNGLAFNGDLIVATPNGTHQPPANDDAPPKPFDVVGSTVDEVVAAVGDGKVTASDALIAEQQGKKRATLIEALTKLVEAESQTRQE